MKGKLAIEVVCIANVSQPLHLLPCHYATKLNECVSLVPIQLNYNVRKYNVDEVQDYPKFPWLDVQKGHQVIQLLYTSTSLRDVGHCDSFHASWLVMSGPQGEGLPVGDTTCTCPPSPPPSSLSRVMDKLISYYSLYGSNYLFLTNLPIYYGWTFLLQLLNQLIKHFPKRQVVRKATLQSRVTISRNSHVNLGPFQLKTPWLTHLSRQN